MDENEVSAEKFDEMLGNLGDVILLSLKYEICGDKNLNDAFETVDYIRENSHAQSLCIDYFKRQGDQVALVYFSHIVYNIKAKSKFILSPGVLRWLTGVWKNFLMRIRVYNNYVRLCKNYNNLFDSFFGHNKSNISKVSNVIQIKDVFIGNDSSPNLELMRLEKYYSFCSEITSVMKGSYFFFIDLAKEIKFELGVEVEGFEEVKKKGLPYFGAKDYNYFSVVENACQGAALCEAAYLILKKKKSIRTIRHLGGQKQFFTTSDVHEFYARKFGEHQRELLELRDFRGK